MQYGAYFDIMPIMPSIMHKTEGVILGHYDIGEADKVINIFTKDFGRISVNARGVRLQKSKLKGHINTGSHVRLAFVEGSEFLRLTDIEEIFNFFHEDLNENIKTASYAISLINRMIQGSEKDEKVWDLFYGFLSFLRKNKNQLFYADYGNIALEKVFGARLLYYLGYVGDVDGDIEKLIKSSDWQNISYVQKHDSILNSIFESGVEVSHL